MNKIVIIYVLTIILIAILAISMNSPIVMFPNVSFPLPLHIILEGTISILMFLIFLVSNYLFLKTDDERMVIFAGGFLIGSVLNTIHIITVKAFPYDLLSLANIQNNPTLVYLLFGNLILPLSIYFALTHKPSKIPHKTFCFKIYSIYFLTFLALTTLPFLVNNFSPNFVKDFDLLINSLDFINYSLYITLAFIVINIRQSSRATFFPMFTTGLIILGLGGLFYINPSLLPVNEILAHIFQLIGLLFILFGTRLLVTYSKYLRFKDELVAHLCVVLIVFYIVFVSIVSALLHVMLPPISAYIFIEFILIFQFIVYLIANEVTRPITNIIDILSKYSPEKEFIEIPIIRNDELGELSAKINAVSKLSFNKILEISKFAERKQSEIRIFEAMRRISNQDIIKNSIIDEIKNALKADRTFIALYNSTDDSFYLDKYIENLPSKTLFDFKDEHQEERIIRRLNELLKNSLELCFSNVNEYITKNALEGSTRARVLRKYKIKSCCNMPIYYSGNLLGCLIIQYTKGYVELDKVDLAYLKTMAAQLGVVINNQRWQQHNL